MFLINLGECYFAPLIIILFVKNILKDVDSV